jgi:hypothetical protein
MPLLITIEPLELVLGSRPVSGRSPARNVMTTGTAVRRPVTSAAVSFRPASSMSAITRRAPARKAAVGAADAHSPPVIKATLFRCNMPVRSFLSSEVLSAEC